MQHHEDQAGDLCSHLNKQRLKDELEFSGFFFRNFFWTSRKGITFDHDFGYSFPCFSSLLIKKREEEKENEVANIMIKSHAFPWAFFLFVMFVNIVVTLFNDTPIPFYLHPFYNAVTKYKILSSLFIYFILQNFIQPYIHLFVCYWINIFIWINIYYIMAGITKKLPRFSIKS